jgi:hypothetical protein
VKTFLVILKSILYGWVTSARDFFAIICKMCSRWKFQRNMDRVVSPNRCVPINDPAFVLPDPLIYDQYYLTSLGLAVTWDNPDIQLYLGGSPVSSSLLAPGTTYEVVAQIWNNSTDCPVVAMPVAFSFLEFGVGTTSVPIGSTEVNLGVKGGPGCPAYATMPWTTPITPGHYCIQVLLQPVADTNFNNNLGQENTNVGTANSPAVFTFTLRNDTRRTQAYKFEVDAYTPGTPDPCGTGPNDAKARAARLARHKRGSHPVPPGWQIVISPDAPSLLVGQSIPITVTATPPPGLTGSSQILNVNAFHARGIAGGVTFTVNII